MFGVTFFDVYICIVCECSEGRNEGLIQLQRCARRSGHRQCSLTSCHYCVTFVDTSAPRSQNCRLRWATALPSCPSPVEQVVPVDHGRCQLPHSETCKCEDTAFSGQWRACDGLVAASSVDAHGHRN